MSTRGAAGEFLYRAKLVVVVALVAALVAIAAGNRLAWRGLTPPERATVYRFEQGTVLDRLRICGQPMMPAAIQARCRDYQVVMASRIGREDLAPRVRDLLLIWPLAAAVGGVLLTLTGLWLRAKRFRRLDDHAPRDHFRVNPWIRRREIAGLLLAALGLAGAFVIAPALFLLALVGLAVLSYDLFAGRRQLRHIRGAQIADAETVEDVVRRRYRTELGSLDIGGIPIPRAVELLNFLVAGAPGTGKSVTIAHLLHAARARNDRVFCADPRGDYLRRFYRAGDLILNPLDTRAAPWSPLCEIHSPADAAAIARAIVPPAEGRDASWHQFAATLLEGVLLHCLSAQRDNAAILRLLLSAPVAELRECLSGHPAAGLLPEASDNAMFHSIRGTATPYLQSLATLDPRAGASATSLRVWARDGGQAAAWWPYADAQIASLRNLISAQLDLLALGVLEQPDAQDRRTWLVLDELAALGRLSTLEDFLARARKAGGCAVLGLQSIAQLRRLYGDHSADAIISTCGNVLALAVGDPTTADYLSRLFGQREISVVNRSASASDSGAQASVARQLTKDWLLLPSEFDPTTLPKLCGFFRLAAGGVPVAPVRLEIVGYPKVAARFEARAVPAPRAAAPAADAMPDPDAAAAESSDAATTAPTPADVALTGDLMTDLHARVAAQRGIGPP